MEIWNYWFWREKRAFKGLFMGSQGYIHIRFHVQMFMSLLRAVQSEKVECKQSQISDPQQNTISQVHNVTMARFFFLQHNLHSNLIVQWNIHTMQWSNMLEIVIESHKIKSAFLHNITNGLVWGQRASEMLTAWQSEQECWMREKFRHRLLYWDGHSRRTVMAARD